jgi:hypothetical protein
LPKLRQRQFRKPWNVKCALFVYKISCQTNFRVYEVRRILIDTILVDRCVIYWLIDRCLWFEISRELRNLPVPWNTLNTSSPSANVVLLTVSSSILPDHLLLDRSPNIGPLISRWGLDKFRNCWNKSYRTPRMLTLLYQQFSNFWISQRDMSGPRLGALFNNRWSWGIVPFPSQTPQCRV